MLMVANVGYALDRTTPERDIGAVGQIGAKDIEFEEAQNAELLAFCEADGQRPAVDDPCALIESLEVTCDLDWGLLKATVESDLPPCTRLRLVADDAFYRDTCVWWGGRARAWWRNPMPGEHEVCIEGCDICATVSCGCAYDEDCDDGDLCTNDVCIDYECVSTPVDCDEGEVCDPETGECITLDPCVALFEDGFSECLENWTVVSEGDNTYTAECIPTDGNPPPSVLLDDLGSYHVFANSNQMFSHVDRCLEISVDLKHGNAASGLQRHAGFRLTGPDGYLDHDYYVVGMSVSASTNPSHPNAVNCRLRYDDNGEDAWETSGYLTIPSGDGWHAGTIAIQPDGFVFFYLDGVFVYESQHPIISRFDGSEVVQIGSRRSFYDNVLVEDCCPG
jgi:hypothetical protein